MHVDITIPSVEIFGEILIGDTFITDNVLYIKTSEPSRAVNLATGTVRTFVYHDRVKRIDTKVVHK